MALSSLQKARQRKLIYFVAILILFTISLIHREFVLKTQAFALQLRETARGEVELTSSAVRLMLTGSRGLAVTVLWYNAMDRQKRNEYHELELIVQSITKLQPYFITPWLYQSWNISFNVAVECDRPRDKYYYISRGLELLAEGERRNRGVVVEGSGPDKEPLVFPGSPDMRYYMGFYYQLKMGTSDERLTMRSLLELSCIDPVERNPDLFWYTDESGQKKVDLPKFAHFCQKHPRLVRRLREQLGKENPANIVTFLQDHQDIPSRFKLVEHGALKSMRQSELKDPDEQFPILPPPEESHWPNRTQYELTSKEAVDVYLVCRTWYEYAQKPLPPASADPGEKQPPDYNKTKYRLPKQMVAQIFRGYPSRAQVYIAETLESEGWFDSTGWVVNGWFTPLTDRENSEFADEEGRFVIGKDPKYYSQRAWEKGYEMYRQYGIANGLYLTPDLLAQLNKEAKMARETLDLRPGQLPNVIPPQFRTGAGGKSLRAHLRLRIADHFRGLANFDAFIDQAEGEKDALTVSMRRLLFEAERKRKRDPVSEAMLSLYDRAWGLYVLTCMDHPKFAQVTSMQEDFYEVYQRSLKEVQWYHKELFKKAALQVASLTPGPATTWPQALVCAEAVAEVANSRTLMLKVVPSATGIRNRRGALDAIRYYDGPGRKELREALFVCMQANAAALSPGYASALLVYPGRAALMLTQAVPRREPMQPRWPWLITPETHRIVDMRVGLNK